MPLAYFLAFYPWVFYTIRHWQTSSRQMQELIACTVDSYDISGYEEKGEGFHKNYAKTRISQPKRTTTKVYQELLTKNAFLGEESNIHVRFSINIRFTHQQLKATDELTHGHILAESTIL